MSMQAPTSVTAFARTCQAAHLLGKVCEHVNENASSHEADLHFEEASQLSRALLALVNMLHEETRNADSTTRHKLFGARGLAYAALSTLYDVHACIEGDVVGSIGGNRGLRLDLQQLAIDGFKEVAEMVSDLAANVEEFVESHGTSNVSPFVLFGLYTVASTYAWQVRENGSEVHLASLVNIKRVLEALGKKWKVAGAWVLSIRKMGFPS